MFVVTQLPVLMVVSYGKKALLIKKHANALEAAVDLGTDATHQALTTGEWNIEQSIVNIGFGQVAGIKDVNDSENEVFSVKWSLLPGETIKIEEEILPNGFKMVPSCEDCDGGIPVVLNRNGKNTRYPVGPVKTIKEFKLTPGTGYIIDFFRKILGFRQGDRFFPEEIVPDVITTTERSIGLPVDVPDWADLAKKEAVTPLGGTNKVRVFRTTTTVIDSSNGNSSTQFPKRDTIEKSYKKTKESSGGTTFGPVGG